MSEESFNKAPGSELSKNRTTVVTMGNVKISSVTSAPAVTLPERLFNTSTAGHAIGQDFPYTVLQYGHLMPTLVQPGFSVFHQPPPPMPMTIPMFYQPVNGGIPQPQPFDANMFYRCVPQLHTGTDLTVSKINLRRNNVIPLKNKIPDSKKLEVASGSSDGCLSPPRDVDFGGSVNGVPVNQDRLVILTEMAMQGCELAEQLAYNHQKRPCFKKIDSLCARMKQDLIRPDTVLANINSQGIAWAVKDFIFVFTRIINAWIIIKGYVYNTPEGLERVQKVLNPDFIEHFVKWQDSTIDFVDSLIKSFTNLDQLVQNQRTSGVQKESNSKSAGNQSKTDEEKERNILELYEYLKNIVPNLAENKASASSNTTSSSDLSDRSSVSYDNAKSYLVPVVNESEHAQMKHNKNGTYFKTGIYEPVKKPPGFISTIPFSSVETGTQSLVTSTPKILKKPIAQDHSELMGMFAFETDAANRFAEMSLTSQVQTDLLDDAIIRKNFDGETVAKIHFLLQKIFSVNEAKYFLVAQFTKNYFPEFNTINPNFIDLRSIISKAQLGGYQNVHGIVQDLRQIVQAANRYIEQKPHSLMKETVAEFERGLEDILSDKIFDCYNFKCMPGSTSPAAITCSNSSVSNLTASSGGF